MNHDAFYPVAEILFIWLFFYKLDVGHNPCAKGAHPPLRGRRHNQERNGCRGGSGQERMAPLRHPLPWVCCGLEVVVS